MPRRAFLRFQLFLLPIIGFRMTAREALGSLLLLIVVALGTYFFMGSLLIAAACPLLILGVILGTVRLYRDFWVYSELDADLQEISLQREREALLTALAGEDAHDA